MNAAGPPAHWDFRRLWSLWEMLTAYGFGYLVAGHALGDAARQLFEWGLLNPEKRIISSDDPVHSLTRSSIGLAGSMVVKLPLGTLEQEIKRAYEQLSRGAILPDRMQQEVSRIYERFKDELQSKLFLYVPPELVSYYRQNEIFGPEVATKFPKSSEDLENAGNCYALGQPTACVFHLMRAMESAVTRLSRRIGVKIVPRDTWGQMLSKMDEKIRLLPERDERQKSKKAKWSEARANLYHVKEAWRNESMHPKKTYTMEQALEVLEAVRVFMVGLADL